MLLRFTHLGESCLYELINNHKMRFDRLQQAICHYLMLDSKQAILCNEITRKTVENVMSMSGHYKKD